MNVLLINTFYFPDILGGAEISVQKLAEGLVRNGHKVSVICTGKQDHYEVLNGVHVFRIKINNLYSPIDSQHQKMWKKSTYRVLDFLNFLNYKKIHGVFKEINPDIIHSNNTYGISPIIWLLAQKLELPIVHTLRDYYLMYPFGNLTNGNNDKKLSSFYEIFHKNVHKRLTKKVNYVTAPSQFTLDKFLESLFFREAKNQVIYNAIDFNEAEVNEWYRMKIKQIDSASAKTTKFVYLGTLGEHKGVSLMLQAFHDIKESDIELHIAGKGPLESLVQELCSKDSRITYHGFLQGKSLDELLLKCDVLLAPSVWYEPFGRVVIDAYKHALPVIGSATGGLKEIIKDNVTGLLIKPNSIPELKKAMVDMHNSSCREEMLLNCREELNTFSIETQIEKFEKVYKDLIH